MVVFFSREGGEDGGVGGDGLGGGAMDCGVFLGFVSGGLSGGAAGCDVVFGLGVGRVVGGCASLVSLGLYLTG